MGGDTGRRSASGNGRAGRTAQSGPSITISTGNDITPSPRFSTISLDSGEGAVEVSRLEEGFLRIREANVVESARGQGLGIALYTEAYNLAQREGRVLTSDSATSESAMRVWEGLQRRGFPVERASLVEQGSDGKFRAMRTINVEGSDLNIQSDEPIWRLG